MNKSKLIRGGISALSLVALSASFAFADEASTSTQNVNAVQPSIVDKFTSTYVNVFDGPAITSLGSPYQSSNLDGTIDTTSPVMFENTISLGYKVSKLITIAPTFYWQYLIGGNDSVKMGGDSYLKISDSNIYTSGNYKASGFLSLYAPVTEESRNKRSVGGARLFVNQNYDISNSKWSLSLWSFAQKYFYNQYEAGIGYKGKAPWSLRVYLGPNANYAVTDTVTLGVLYEASSRLRFGKSVFSGWENPNPDGSPSTDIEPNVNWDITKKISFNPYLNIPVSGRVALDTTTIGSYLVWKLL